MSDMNRPGLITALEVTAACLLSAAAVFVVQWAVGVAAGMSDIFWQSFFLFCQACFGGVVLCVLTWMKRGIEGAVVNTGAMAAVKVEAVREAAVGAADKVEEVKQTAALIAGKVAEVNHALMETAIVTGAKIDAIAQLGKSTHELVNSAMTEQLNKYAKMARLVADMRPDNKESQAVAEEAERAVSMSNVKQQAADASSKEIT